MASLCFCMVIRILRALASFATALASASAAVAISASLTSFASTIVANHVWKLSASALCFSLPRARCTSTRCAFFSCHMSTQVLNIEDMRRFWSTSSALRA